MAEQNAHDDERDTADLATNDAADLAAGDATDLVTDDTADLAIDDTSDSAVDDASDLAAGDAADLAADDASRPQAPAEQLTPAGRAVSPSPSPTPTFAATDRPARRARRLRWKPGITRPMMALSAASFALMVAGVGGYVSAIPAVVASEKPSTVVIPLESALWLDGQMREVQAGPVSSTRAVGPVTIEASKVDAAAPDAAAALGLGSASGGMLGVASLTGASGASSVDSSFARAQQIAGGASAASGVWLCVWLRGFRRLVAGGLGVCGKRFRVRFRLRLGQLRQFGRRVGRCERLGLGLGKRRRLRLRFRSCACRPHGRAGGGGVCCAGGPSGPRERLCCAREQRRCRVQQRLYEHVASPSPKRLRRVRGHRWANAHRLPAAARFEGVRRRVALAGAEGQPSASLHRAGSVFDRHLQCVGVELGIREPGRRG